MEAQEQIMLLREGVLELKEENFALREQVRQLEDTLKVRGELKFDGAVYWQQSEGNRDGPFCPQCWDNDERLGRLQGVGDFWQCFTHNSLFRKR